MSIRWATHWEPSEFPDGFLVLGGAVAEPVVLLPVPIPVVDPPVDEPAVPPLMDEPPVVEPAPAEPPAPPVCANANVLDSANAVARAIVVSFIVRSLCVVSCRPNVAASVLCSGSFAHVKAYAAALFHSRWSDVATTMMTAMMLAPALARIGTV